MSPPRKTPPVERRSPLPSVSARLPTIEQRERAFVREYLKDYNGTRAAIRVGYAPSGAHVQACRLLRKPNVVAMLGAIGDEATAKAQVTVNDVVGELTKLGFANMKRYARLDAAGRPHLDLSRATDDDWAAITALESTTETAGGDGEGRGAVSVTKSKIRLADKRAPLVDLGRHLGMFSEDGERPPTVTYIVERTIISAHLKPDDSIGPGGKPNPNWRG